MRMIPNQGEERRLHAKHIGHIVLISAQLDAAIIMCVTAATGDLMAAFGMSGKQLGEKMCEVETTPEVHDRLVALADRYLDLYKWRNQIVHGSHIEGALINIKPLTKQLREAMARDMRRVLILWRSTCRGWSKSGTPSMIFYTTCGSSSSTSGGSSHGWNLESEHAAPRHL